MSSISRIARCLYKRLRADERGVILTEVIIASSIFLVVSTALMGVLVSSTSITRLAKARTISEQGVASQIETIRSMQYDLVGTVNGNPSGSIQPSQTFVGVNGENLGVAATMTTQISYEDSNVPGTYVSGADFKKVVVTITENANSRVLASATTFLAPAVRPAQNTATISATVVDFGTNAAMPNVPVNLSTGPSAPRSDVSDAAGDVSFPALTPNPTSGSQAYYDLSTTLPFGYVALADPSQTHVQLAPTQSFTATLNIYQPGTLFVALQNPDGSTYTGNANVTVTSSRGSHTFAYSGSTLSITTLSPPSGELLVPGLSYTIAVASSGKIINPASQTVFMASGLNPTAYATSVVNVLPTKLVFTSGAVSGAASTSPTMGPITVQEQDSTGAPVPAPAGGAVVSLTSSSNAGVFSLTSGGAPVTSVTIPGGATSATFYYGDTKSGTPTLTGHNAAIATNATQVETVTAAAVTQLVFTSSAFTGAATSSPTLGPITVQRQDAFGNPVTTGSAVVSLSSDSSGTTKFALTSGGSAVTTVTIASGASTATFYYGDTSADPATTITAHSATIATDDTQVETITPAAANKLVFTTAAVTGPASSSATLGPITVQEQDAFGNPVTAGTVIVALTSNTTGTGRFSLTSGGAGVLTVTIPSGSSSANFYYGDTKGGTPTITGSTLGLTSATQVETITASKLAFTSTAINAAATATSTLGPITVQRQDTLGNGVTVGGAIVVSLSSTSPTDSYSLTSGGAAVTSVTIPAGSSSVSFYYGDTTAGTPTVTGQNAAIGTNANQVETITPAAASTLTFTSAAVTGQASASATLGPITVQRQDAFGNLVTSGSAVVTLTSNTSGTAKFSLTSGGASVTTVTIAAGSSSANFYYGDTKGGTPTITGHNAAIATDATQVETITASKLVFTSTALNAAATATATLGPITVQRQDTLGNAVTVGGAIVVSLNSTSPTDSYSLTSGGAAVTTVTIPAGSSSVTFYYGDTTAGTPTMTGTNASITTGASQVETITAAAVSNLVFTSTALSGTAASTANLGPATVRRQDAFGNPVTGGGAIVVSLTSTSGGAKFSLTSGGAVITTVTIASGASSATFFYGDTVAGTPTLTAHNSTIANDATQTATVNPAAASKLVFTSTTITGAASATATMGPLTVQRQDAFGNPTTTGSIAVGLSSNTTGTARFSLTSGGGTVTTVTIASGSSSASFFYGDTKTGTPTITAAFTGLTSATQAQTVTASKLVFTSSAVTGAASATANMGPITVARQDTLGNAVTLGGATVVSLFSTSGTAVFSLTSGGASIATVTIPAGSSSVTFFYGDTQAGSPTLTGQNAAIPTNASQAETVTPGAATKLVIASAPVSGQKTSPANAKIGPITVQRQDAFGNPTTLGGAIAVALSSNTSGTSKFSLTSGGSGITTVTIASGASSANFFYGDTLAGSPTITGAFSGLTSATQVETVTP